MVTTLMVNESKIELNEMAHLFLTNIVLCAVSMLKGGQDVKTLDFSLNEDKVNLVINGQVVPLSPFPRDALKGTITGMVSSLKGIHNIDRLVVNMKLQ